MKLTDDIRATLKAHLTAVPAPSKNPTRRRELAGYRYNGGRPFDSDAMGINPAQVDQANKELRRHNCTAEYQPDGTLRVTSEKQFHEVARISGMRTGRDGYFGGLDEDGRPQRTGRQVEHAKREFERKLLSGEIDIC